jgi:uncharacterized surface protein with fasciclin (FAS1) repeats
LTVVNVSTVNPTKEKLMKRFRTLAILAAALVLTIPAFAGPNDSDIVDVAVGAGSFNTLVTAVQAAGLVDALKGDGPFTVFAPTDEAFAKLPAGTVESLLEPKNIDQLKSILTYHVIPGKVMAASVTGSETRLHHRRRQRDDRRCDGRFHRRRRQQRRDPRHRHRPPSVRSVAQRNRADAQPGRRP